MSQQDAFDRILASLHEACFDDAHWPETSALIDEACRAKGNILSFGVGASQRDVEVFFAWFCYRGQRRQDLERWYFERYHPWDERLPRLRQLAHGRLVLAADLYTDVEKTTSPAYNEAMLRCDTKNSLNVRLDGPDGSRIVWGVADPIDADGWSSAQTETVERLLPHLCQFVGVRQALANARALSTSLMGLLDNSRSGVIELDRRGRIVAANDRARDILRQADALSDQGGFLHALSSSDDAELQMLLARALPPFGSQGAAGSMMVSRPPVMPRLVLHVTPVGERHMAYGPQSVAALVLVVDPISRARLDPDPVAAVLGLTSAESQMAVLLAEGRSVRDIAAAGRSEHTVRWHMKHIFAKLGVSRQAELVHLVLSLAPLPKSRH